MNTDNKTESIMKEPGVKDLPIRVKGPLIRALRIERQAGQTTAEALEELAKAIAAEEALLVDSIA